MSMLDVLYSRREVHQNTLRRIRESELSATNKSLIFKFNDECFARGLSTARVEKYMYKLKKIARWLEKDFPDATIDDIKRVVMKVEQAPVTPYTKKEYKMCLRKLYQWLRGTEDYPPEVRWIKLGTATGYARKLPEDMITQDEVLRLVNAAMTARDRAFVSVLYEAGCRIAELLLVKIGHVQFDSLGAQLRVDGKTGCRRIRIVSSVPQLTSWLNEHPDKDNPDAYLWVKSDGTIIKYNSSRMILDRLARRSGVKKKVNPHNFRHSRATFLANHLTEAQMKEYFGWTGRSDMPAVYVHLSGRDVDNAILKLHGIKQEDDKEEERVLAPRKCVRCQTANPASHKLCSLCGLPLDEQSATHVIRDSLVQSERREADCFLDSMLDNPGFREAFRRRAGEVALEARSRRTSDRAPVLPREPPDDKGRKGGAARPE